MKDLAQLLLEYQGISLYSSGADASGLPANNHAASITDNEVVSWKEVQAFIRMMEGALGSKQRAAEAVADKEATAREESSFLESELSSLYAEKLALQQRVDKLERENQSLAAEVALLRDQLAFEEARVDEESPGARAAKQRLHEELRVERARAGRLEHEVLQLQARAAALERAGKAQQTALISCLEEQERASLQQGHPSSPGGPVEWHTTRSERTVDSISLPSGLEGEHSAPSLPGAGSSGQATPRTAGTTPLSSPGRVTAQGAMAYS